MICSDGYFPFLFFLTSRHSKKTEKQGFPRQCANSAAEVFFTELHTFMTLENGSPPGCLHAQERLPVPSPSLAITDQLAPHLTQAL